MLFDSLGVCLMDGKEKERVNRDYEQVEYWTSEGRKLRTQYKWRQELKFLKRSSHLQYTGDACILNVPTVDTMEEN